MADTPDEHDDDQPLSERLLDLFVFLPTGLAVTLAEELPRLAERGRERLGVQVNSARAVGKFAVRAGGHEFKKRSGGLNRPSEPAGAGSAPPSPAATPSPRASIPSSPPRLRSIPRPPTTGAPASASTAPAATVDPVAATPSATGPVQSSGVDGDRAAASTSAAAPPQPRPSGGHVPEVGSLAIPGFDTLSASQVVQRLDGLSRSELVAARAYETANRGRRTILSRVDQLLDERS